MGLGATSIQSVQIFANQATSGAVDLSGYDLFALEMPDTFNGTTLTIQGKPKNREDITNSAGAQQSNEDWDDVYDSAGNQISLTVAAGRIVVPTAAHAAALAPLRYVRFVAGTNQGATREIRIICKSSA